MGEANRRQQLGIQNGQQQIEVDLSKTTQKICLSCGSVHFQPAVSIHIVSPILSPIGKELPIQVPALLCVNCRQELDLANKPAISG